ncbi:radical SAM protein [Streptomyces sp. C10-9-1]|uniref:radical SAM protein n=1 Tax=Streptomyces sp. C10-9-1 TaxID=1859285 RepID=UPI003F4A3F06
MAQEPTRQVQFVTKVSKFCNLRCTYCYEFAELDRRERMSREQLHRMYVHLRDYYVGKDQEDGARTHLHIVWHGGEPLMIEPDYYWRTLEDQRAVFGDSLRVSNTVQTNLTLLDDERLRLLRDGFDNVGVSLDLFSGLRVNIAGRDQQAKVVSHMERLRSEGVPFGCITVLTRKNLGRVKDTFSFYERAGLGFRVLPLFEGAYADQHEAYDITVPEIVSALNELADLWLCSDNPVQVSPLDHQLQIVLRHLDPKAPRSYFNQREWLPVIVVNTPGDVYAYGDPYEDLQASLGNIFTTPLGELLSGPRFDASARAAETRMAANCLNCKYFGACSGAAIANNRDNVHTEVDGIGVCDVDRAVLQHIEDRLRSSGVLDGDGRVATAPAPAADPVA